jgi:hypothetical protein
MDRVQGLRGDEMTALHESLIIGEGFLCESLGFFLRHNIPDLPFKINKA